MIIKTNMSEEFARELEVLLDKYDVTHAGGYDDGCVYMQLRSHKPGEEFWIEFQPTEE